MTVEKKETHVRIKENGTERVFPLPSERILREHSMSTKQIDENIYEFKTSKPVRVELWADIKEVILSDDILISGEGHVSRELAKIMKCKITSPYTIVCEAVIDGAKGFVDRNTAEIIVGKKEDEDLFWVKSGITRKEYEKFSKDIQEFVRKTGYMRGE